MIDYFYRRKCFIDKIIEDGKPSTPEQTYAKLNFLEIEILPLVGQLVKSLNDNDNEETKED